LLDFIGCIEQRLGRVAEKRMLPMQPGDVPATYADTSALGNGSTLRRATPLSGRHRALRRLVSPLLQGLKGK
jgi:UDP-glucuronate 4-epimerase